MGTVITATFAGGVLRPEGTLDLAEGTKVRLVLETWDDARAQSRAACAELDELCAEHPIDSQGRLLSRDELHERR